MSDFDVFKNRWVISAKLNMVTPLCIGGGQNAGSYSLSQAPVLQSYDAKTDMAKPYIPGSSIKGVLRSTIERLVRTVNENHSCIAVSDNKKEALCGDCITCGIFGSMEYGSKIQVEDSHLTGDAVFGDILNERPHCATIYTINRGSYEVVPNKRRRGNRQVEVPKTNLRFEEIVSANTSFDLNLKLDNADEYEVGFVLLALYEFNNKRAYLGGGVSRGNGFAEVEKLEVVKKTVNSDLNSLYNINEENYNPSDLTESAKNQLRDADNKKNVDRRDFDVYYNAYTPKNDLNGHFVVKYNLKTLKNFKLPGAEEITVTDKGIPIIPGSTIKGHLRHKLIENGKNANKIDEMFGSMKGHSSRLVISDAYPTEDFSDKNEIPKGTELEMWAVFDNIEKDELVLIDETLKNGPIVTGKRTAGYSGRSNDSSHNRVKFKAEGLTKFNVNDFLSG